MKMCLREIGRESAGWFDAEHDKDKWQTLANTVMNLQVPYFFFSTGATTHCGFVFCSPLAEL